MNEHKMLPGLCLATLLYVCIGSKPSLFVNSFVLNNNVRMKELVSQLPGYNSYSLRQTRKNKLCMIDPFTSGSDIWTRPVFTSPFGISLPSSPFESISKFIASMPSFVSTDPAVAAQILNDMSHLAMDFATTLFSKLFSDSRNACSYNKILGIRSAAILGRLFAIFADYLPDHRIVPEELAFQLFMLTTAWIALFQTVLPWALATLVYPATNASSRNQVTIRDGKAFSSLFKPAGVTWSQYKALSAFCFEWTSFKPGDIINKEGSSGDFMYWLYSGEVRIHYCGTQANASVRSFSKVPSAGTALFEEKKLCNIVSQMSRNQAFNWAKVNTTVQANVDNTEKTATIIAGHTNSCSFVNSTTQTDETVLLRIDIQKLILLMRSDAELAEAIKTLLFQSMQDKLCTYQNEQ